jgi:hypothetical protein
MLAKARSKERRLLPKDGKFEIKCSAWKSRNSAVAFAVHALDSCHVEQRVEMLAKSKRRRLVSADRNQTAE